MPRTSLSCARTTIALWRTRTSLSCTSGSNVGTSLEPFRRRCYGIEIEPILGDVILRRAEAEGGLSVEKAVQP